MMTAKTACGRFLSKSLAKIQKAPTSTTVIKPAICVRAPAVRFTTLRLKLPAIGNDWLTAAAILAAPNASSSCVLLLLLMGERLTASLDDRLDKYLIKAMAAEEGSRLCH